MPCGGILPLYRFGKKWGMPRNGGRCWTCKKPGAKHFLEEFDAFIHARCTIFFLTTPEGDVVMAHGHRVMLDFALEDEHEDQDQDEGQDEDEEEEEEEEEQEQGQEKAQEVETEIDEDDDVPPLEDEDIEEDEEAV